MSKLNYIKKYIALRYHIIWYQWPDLCAFCYSKPYLRDNFHLFGLQSFGVKIVCCICEYNLAKPIEGAHLFQCIAKKQCIWTRSHFGIFCSAHMDSYGIETRGNSSTIITALYHLNCKHNVFTGKYVQYLTSKLSRTSSFPIHGRHGRDKVFAV